MEKIKEIGQPHTINTIFFFGRDVPCTETGHDDGLLVVRRKLHDGWLD